MKKDQNWYPGIQRQQPFVRGVELDNPRHRTKAQVQREKSKPAPEQQTLPLDVGYLEPQLCPECYGMGRERKGKVCRACGGEGIIPADANAKPAEGD